MHRKARSSTAASSVRALSIGAAVLATLGCVGVIEDFGSGEGSGAGAGSGNTGTNGSAVCGVPPAPLRRLTAAEYDNTIRDLLGDTSSPASAFPPDENITGFAAGTSVSSLQTELYMTAAEQLAATAKTKLGSLLPCDPAGIGESECARQFIEEFGRRAFRRPLASSELDRFVKLYETERALEPFDASVELLIIAFLQSSQFLYRPELGKPGDTGEGGRVALSSYELASRLSYFLWQTMPDEQLFQLASEDRLQDPAVLGEQATRMLSDARAKQGILGFFEQWFHLGELTDLSKSETAYPQFTPTLKQAMREETRRFVEEVMWGGDGRLETLFTGNFTWVNGELAQHYGIAGVSGTDFTRVTLDPAQRAGILTHGSVMSILAGPEQSSPVHRGAFVREQLLCQVLAPPPENLNVVPPEVDPNLSTRERFEQHVADPACAGCHMLTDPIGFGFEHYDAVGRYRSEDSGFPIDASGEIVQSDDADGPFVGAIELAARLSGSAQVRRCVAQQFFRFAAARPNEPADDCSIDYAYQALDAAGGDMTKLVIALVQTESFRHRPVLEGQP